MPQCERAEFRGYVTELWVDMHFEFYKPFKVCRYKLKTMIYSTFLSLSSLPRQIQCLTSYQTIAKTSFYSQIKGARYVAINPLFNGIFQDMCPTSSPTCLRSITTRRARSGDNHFRFLGVGSGIQRSGIFICRFL